MRTSLCFLLVSLLALPVCAEETAIAPARSGAALAPGPAVLIGDNVNLRGRPAFTGEVITKLNEGDVVTVLEVVLREKSAPGEPPQWAKIQMPTNASVFVFAPFLDATNKTVKAARLNLRGGPGENYSVVGRLNRGDQVTELLTVGEWTKIEAPTSAFAFVAAEFLQQTPPATLQPKPAPTSAPTPVPPPTPTPAAKPAPEPTPAVVPSTPVPAAEAVVVPTPVPAEDPVVTRPATNAAPAVPNPLPLPAMAAPTNTPNIAPLPPTATPTNPPSSLPLALVESPTNAPAPGPSPAPLGTLTSSPTPVTNQPSPFRVVTRDGIVRPTTSIQAPTDWQIVDVRHHRPMAFLRRTSNEVKLFALWDKRVAVVGVEAIDRRWPNLPVLTIEEIERVSE
jgi:uncharacterized protein YgiM (DUF1202 family)